MGKRHYSAFSGTDLDIRLRERRVDTVILTGVLTDICVLHTAIDAYNLGYQIEVVKPAVASIWPENHQFALGHFKNTLGAKLLDENLVKIKNNVFKKTEKNLKKVLTKFVKVDILVK